MLYMNCVPRTSTPPERGNYCAKNALRDRSLTTKPPDPLTNRHSQFAVISPFVSFVTPFGAFVLNPLLPTRASIFAPRHSLPCNQTNIRKKKEGGQLTELVPLVPLVLFHPQPASARIHFAGRVSVITSVGPPSSGAPGSMLTSSPREATASHARNCPSSK
jgi:hypothetical protein